MFPQFVLILLIPLPQSNAIVRLDYCAHHNRNTPCMFDCTRSASCGHTQTKYSDLTPDLRNYIANEHNLYRSMLASQEKFTLKPPLIPKFNPISYDKECEFIAGCYLKQCRNHPDKKRISLDGQLLGQNRYVVSMKRSDHSEGSYNASTLRFLIFEAALRSWIYPGYLLRQVHHPEIHDSYAPIVYPQRTSTFSQMVWEETLYVGCAFMHSQRDSKWDMYEILCNYKPAGNILGLPVYRLDNSKSTCTQKLFGKSFMCVEKFRPLADDTYEAPIDLNRVDAIQMRNIAVCLIGLLIRLVIYVKYD